MLHTLANLHSFWQNSLQVKEDFETQTCACWYFLLHPLQEDEIAGVPPLGEFPKFLANHGTYQMPSVGMHATQISLGSTNTDVVLGGTVKHPDDAS